ncbi:hypothetical protein BV898_10470 [Hypsibius exemplaris]|uniref:Uncharacterized protein n=1 Tax=Hypsibius exemplaris TaxID=2072580 RepID=A0A1W0WJH9_HYPEX|nr:hypothetical protein BV898_10470 [Hypsibius exemplaris]
MLDRDPESGMLDRDPESGMLDRDPESGMLDRDPGCWTGFSFYSRSSRFRMDTGNQEAECYNKTWRSLDRVNRQPEKVKTVKVIAKLDATLSMSGKFRPSTVYRSLSLWTDLFSMRASPHCKGTLHFEGLLALASWKSARQSSGLLIRSDVQLSANCHP